jgi:PleD family two-component response regulator
MAGPTFQKIHYDRGNGRTYYNVVGDTLKPKKLYCRYDGEEEILVCSKDGEPSHAIANTQFIIKEK